MKLCGFEVGIDKPLFLIAGPCVVESEQLAMDTAGQLKELTAAWAWVLSISLPSTRPIALPGIAFVVPAWKRG